MADTPMSRAEYGTGSLYQRRSDWRWMATLEGGYTESGGRKRLTVTGKGCVGGCAKRCPHLAAIKRKLRDKRLELDRDGHRNVKRTTSVAKWAGTWLENIQTEVTPSAYETDKAAVRAIVAAIGAVKLADVTPSDVRAVAKYLRKQGNKSSTALRYHGSLMRMLKAASLAGYSIQPNVLLAKKPKKSVSDRDAVPVDQAIKVLTWLAKLPPTAELVRTGGVSRWALTFLQGHRSAETRGLTWPEVDLDDAETLTISWQVKSLRYREKGNPAAGFLIPDGYEARHLIGSTHLVRPKSAAGWRVQPLVPWAANALRAWREVAPDNPHGLIWPGRTNKGGTWPLNAASHLDEWHDIQQAVGIAHPAGRPYHVHEIRHGTATLLMELGVPESVRIAIMGHSSMTVTRGYEHVDVSQVRLALEKMAERLTLTAPSPAGTASAPAGSPL